MEGCGFGPNTINSSLPPSQPWGHLTGPFGLYNLPITPSNQAIAFILYEMCSYYGHMQAGRGYRTWEENQKGKE